MKPTTHGSELSVAVLMDDLASAKEISSALRNCDIYAHLYQTLEEFWVGSKVGVPDLVIVDVTKMSQGSVQFRQHPRVADQTMRYVFFSRESTKVLLQSTLGLSPVSYLNGDSSLAAQVTALVKSVRADKERSALIAELKGKTDRLQARTQRLLSERSGAEEFKAHFDFIRTLSEGLETESTRTDFTHALINKLDQWDAIDSFGIFELNQSGQKLVSPDVSRKKFHPFPALWLGQANALGIEPFAQEMAQQVAKDLFDIAPIQVNIHSGSHNPDILLFVSYKEDRMGAFPWDVLSGALSSSLRKAKLHRELPQYSSQFLPMWEALDEMDKLQKNGSDADFRIVGLSLVPLTHVVKRKPQNKFFWSAFFNDFFLQLSGRLQKTTRLSLFGPWHVMFFIPKEDLETEVQMLKAFIKQFGYWKFFEDTNQVLSEEMYPILKLLPASSAHYLRIFEREFADSAITQEEKQLLTVAREKTAKPAPRPDTRRLSN